MTTIDDRPAISSPPADLPLRLLATMLRIRRFEERIEELYRAGELPGFVHLSIVQEACAAGACAALRRDDYITSTHRGHGHCIAKGAETRKIMAELYARATGVCKGKGGRGRGRGGARGCPVGRTLPIDAGPGVQTLTCDGGARELCFLPGCSDQSPESRGFPVRRSAGAATETPYV